MLLSTIFKFAPNEQPRSSRRVPPGGKDSVSFSDDNKAPAPARPRSRGGIKHQDVDHIVFSEQDSIPHSIYLSPAKHHPVKDSCGKLINDMDHVPIPNYRFDRKQVAHSRASMGNILNHEVQQVIPHRGRAHLVSRQTFTIA